MRIVFYTGLILCLLLNTTKAQVKVIESGFIFEEAPFKACHASTLVELSNHQLMSAWFAGSNEGNKDVAIWMAIKQGKTWSKPRMVADGVQNDTLRYPCWNPVLFKAANGLLFLHYKVGPNPRTWWAEVKTSTNDGKTWSKATKLPNGFLGPIKNKPLQLKNGDILYPSSTESLDEKTWHIHLEKSDRNGENWKKITINCGTFGVIQPSILQYPDGRLQLLCRSRQNVIVSAWSTDQGQSWSKLEALSLANPNSGTDAVSLKNGQQLLVYNPLSAGKDWWEGRSVLKLAISANGLDWNDIFTLENHEKGEYSYPAIIQTKDGTIHISYTSERQKIKYLQLKL
ncbi:exo-alpha-sialidase [Pedobacter sp. Hv1]|uniref:sialidase family protein n=1 Tax=Pedobacter sp. Hv1 TaxID=1740090 RepID=UPI0006D8C1E4|nr:sialidase family protein [Pedobacter sp. Hv1]KQB98930.1 sialidase [Pedobacter sp. Hv1]